MIRDIHFRALINNYEIDYSVLRMTTDLYKEQEKKGNHGQLLGDAAYFEHLTADILGGLIQYKERKSVEDKLAVCCRYLGGTLVSYQYID